MESGSDNPNLPWKTGVPNLHVQFTSTTPGVPAISMRGERSRKVFEGHPPGVRRPQDPLSSPSWSSASNRIRGHGLLEALFLLRRFSFWGDEIPNPPTNRCVGPAHFPRNTKNAFSSAFPGILDSRVTRIPIKGRVAGARRKG